jgi:hypothetical protein
MASKTFTPGSFLIRLLIAALLVFASYNPSGYSWYHWLVNIDFEINPMVILAGVVLLIGWVIFLRATFRSLGAVGTMLAVTLFGVIVWALIYYGWLSLENIKVLEYVVLIVVSALLATGMSWSHIRRRMTGQLDVDDIEDSA